MKKTTLTAGLLLGALVFLGASPAHAANSVDGASSTSPNVFKLDKLAFKPKQKDQIPKKDNGAKADQKIVKKPAPVKKKPIQHTIAKGETLSSVAKKYDSSWMRLFAKNKQIADPNIVRIGQKITIPSASEKLAERPLPVTQPQAVAKPAVSQNPAKAAYKPVQRGQTNSAGNTYTAGYCTWYVKQRRPDLPNSLGNAYQWVTRAQALGFATGSTPKPGAVGQQGDHVVYVESVNSGGTVTISEMNYQGLYVTSSRTVPAGSFTYIY